MAYANEYSGNLFVYGWKLAVMEVSLSCGKILEYIYCKVCVYCSVLSHVAIFRRPFSLCFTLFHFSYIRFVGPVDAAAANSWNVYERSLLHVNVLCLPIIHMLKFFLVKIRAGNERERDRILCSVSRSSLCLPSALITLKPDRYAEYTNTRYFSYFHINLIFYTPLPVSRLGIRIIHYSLRVELFWTTEWKNGWVKAGRHQPFAIYLFILFAKREIYLFYDPCIRDPKMAFVICIYWRFQFWTANFFPYVIRVHGNE